MLSTNIESTRTLTLVLPEAEWRALRSVEPNAVGWLQELIKARLAQPSTPSPATPPADRWWGDDY